MAAFADNLARLAVIATGELPLPRDLGEWACAAIEDLQRVRGAELPPSLSRSLRDARILAAAAAAPDEGAWARAALLLDEGRRVQRTWQASRSDEGVAGTMRGELLAAMRWQRLPESVRTYYELLKRNP